MTLARLFRLGPGGLLMLVLLGGCGGEDSGGDGAVRLGPTDRGDPAAVALLDSGNAAYRAREYETALRHYRAAAGLDTAMAATWFGVYMAELALGDTAAADSALARARKLAPELGAHPSSAPAPRGS